MSQLLITGGAGFIGSHVCLSLLEGGNNLVVIDDFSNSSRQSLQRVCQLASIKDERRLKVFQGDIRNPKDLQNAFDAIDSTFDAVVHFAGLKAVGESCKSPLRYWDVNVNGTRCLLEVMKNNDCRTIVFSSSATLYGYPDQVPTPESADVRPVNPYGHTKAAVEQMLADMASSEPGWRIASLRYFNPVGAHPSGLIGEDPNGTPNNLFPYISQVAVGRLKELEVFGCDWPTVDGSAVRDYIHVMDLAEGHCEAIDFLNRDKPQVITFNLGTGNGYSVVQVINAFEKVTGIEIPYRMGVRRIGDVACSIADPSLVAERLGWKTKRSLSDMCRDSWAWQKANPFGYCHH